MQAWPADFVIDDDGEDYATHDGSPCIARDVPGRAASYRRAMLRRDRDPILCSLLAQTVAPAWRMRTLLPAGFRHAAVGVDVRSADASLPGCSIRRMGDTHIHSCFSWFDIIALVLVNCPWCCVPLFIWDVYLGARPPARQSRLRTTVGLANHLASTLQTDSGSTSHHRL